MTEPSSQAPSGSSTPNARFTAQSHTAEDVLKEQTYGLVHFSDFRKRRAEAQELSGRVTQDGTPIASGAATPDGREASEKAAFKKRKKGVKKGGGLSFGSDDEETDGTDAVATPAAVSRSATPAQSHSPAPPDPDESTTIKKRLKPNTSLPFAPKALTKSALSRETQLKEELRKVYTQQQEAVKQTDFVIPFTFFDGKSASGGICRLKKGDYIWLFLERARKVGADLAGKGDRSKKDWARIGVDDLMVVRGDLIVPHHYDFHYFILNRTVGYNKKPIFSYSAEPTAATPTHLLPATEDSKASMPQPDVDQLSTAASRKAAVPATIPDSDLEGYNDDPSFTKVVDRRWYDKNKHIYPASLWEEFDPERDYSNGSRKDTEGNAYFFSRR